MLRKYIMNKLLIYIVLFSMSMYYLCTLIFNFYYGTCYWCRKHKLYKILCFCYLKWNKFLCVKKLNVIKFYLYIKFSNRNKPECFFLLKGATMQASPYYVPLCVILMLLYIWIGLTCKIQGTMDYYRFRLFSVDIWLEIKKTSKNNRFYWSCISYLLFNIITWTITSV